MNNYGFIIAKLYGFTYIDLKFINPIHYISNVYTTDVYADNIIKKQSIHNYITIAIF